MVIYLGGLSRNSVDSLTDRARNDLKSVEGPLKPQLNNNNNNNNRK